MFNVKVQTLKKELRRRGIPIRNLSEANKLSRITHFRKFWVKANEERFNQALELRKAGASLRKIGRDLKMCRTTLYRHFPEQFLPMARRKITAVNISLD